jgi:hypothetical protein
VYFLPEYLQLTKKRELMELSVTRFRNKMKIVQAVRKCLLYKVVTINEFYETKLFIKDPMVLPILFMIRQFQTSNAN